MKNYCKIGSSIVPLCTYTEEKSPIGACFFADPGFPCPSECEHKAGDYCLSTAAEWAAKGGRHERKARKADPINVVRHN